MPRALALVVALVLASAVQATSPWRVFALDDAPPATFSVAPDGAVTARADGAVAFLYRAVEAPAGARLAWRWRVDRDIPAVPLDRVGDDRPLAVHVWFPAAGVFGALRAGLAELAGAPPIGYALTYVWGGTAARGAIVPNPHLDTGAIVVLRPGGTPTATWFDETVDVAADFKRAFGFAAPAPSHLAISADTDDTATSSAGVVAGLDFVEP